ncbi:MAG: hypothetical protein QUU85_11960, partial [Candidatus Eisenbacteria bacterium]|nr:hypothetical protein [Candidatus Eisenbacteria bacterium]
LVGSEMCIRDRAYRAGSRPGTFAALYTSHEALAADLAPRIEPGDRVLFKGARATAMETVYEACRRRLEGRG